MTFNSRHQVASSQKGKSCVRHRDRSIRFLFCSLFYPHVALKSPLYIYLYLTSGSCPLKQRMKSIIVELGRILTTRHCLFDHQGTCSCHVICPKENKYFVTKNLPVAFVYPVVRIIMHTCLILGCSVFPVIVVSSHWYPSIHPSISYHPYIHTSVHPRRPRGSQSGQGQTRNESFQARLEEPLVTQSHRAISKRLSECWLVIASNRRIASSEFFTCVRTRQLLSRHTCPVRLQRKLSFSNFLTRNEGTIYG